MATPEKDKDKEPVSREQASGTTAGTGQSAGTNAGTGTAGTATADTGTQPQSQGGMTLNLPSLPLNEVMQPKRLLWYGGLAALGVVGVLEWPVVAAVGVGSYVAERFAKSDIQKGRTHRP